MVLVYFAILGCAVGALLGILVAHLLRLVRMSWRRSLYLVAVAASIAPYALHYRYALQHLARSRIEGYSGLDQYTSTVPTAMALAILGTVLVAWRLPSVAALLPVVFGGVYWLFLVPLLYRGAPYLFVGLDNVPFVWLFASSVAGCVFLLLLVVFALSHRDRGNPESAVVRAEHL